MLPLVFRPKAAWKVLTAPPAGPPKKPAAEKEEEPAP